MHSTIKQLYVNLPVLGLGFIKRKSKMVAEIGIVSTGEYMTVPIKGLDKITIPQVVKIDQVGLIKLYDCIKVRTSNESYVLQLLRISNEGCTFAKFWRDPDTNICRNGVLILDSNDFFKATEEVMKLRKLTKLPNWMTGRANSPILQFKRAHSKHLNRPVPHC
jgi:hypothetical protein